MKIDRRHRGCFPVEIAVLNAICVPISSLADLIVDVTTSQIGLLVS